MKDSMNPLLISIRDLAEDEIPHILDYWFRSPPGFLEMLGVDLKKMSEESEMRTNLTERIKENAKLPASKFTALAIIYDGHAVPPKFVKTLG